MELFRLGEKGLIERIRSLLQTRNERILLGIGDDAAVVSTLPDRNVIFTTDALVETVHFDRRYVPLDSLGWKALAVNLSDIAAMGGFPLCAVVSLAIPETWSVEDVDSFYQGVDRCAQMYHCPIVGGNTVRSPQWACITVTVLGEVQGNAFKTRAGAKEGDFLCVTGTIGKARLGWEVLESGIQDPAFSSAVAHFLEPRPKLEEAQRVLSGYEVTAMIDISDGLGSEIFHLCEASGLGCQIFEEKIPVLPEVFLWAQAQKKSIEEYLWASGEEYELLFTVSPRSSFKPMDFFTVIGKMEKKEHGIFLQKEGEKRPFPLKGWDHFRNGYND